jgi:ribonuclease VapC
VIVDSSAIVAIIRAEPPAERCRKALRDARTKRMSAASYLEAAIVVDNLDRPGASTAFDTLIARFALRIEPATLAQVRVAREAYQRYGRGSGHPARLNFGDCFAYALAKEFDEPLLFVGNDFVHTDVRRALE